MKKLTIKNQLTIFNGTSPSKAAESLRCYVELPESNHQDSSPSMYGFTNTKLRLNEEQHRAATYEGDASNVLVKAGAGCGKTSTIVGRTQFLINSRIDPKRILLITFTNRAADEIMHRVRLQMDYDSHQIFAGTFHGFCLSQIKKNVAAFGLSGTTIIEDDDIHSLFTLVKTRILSNHPEHSHLTDIKSARLANNYSYMRNTRQRPAQYIKNVMNIEDGSVGIMKKIFEGYEEAKRERNYIDFDDMLELFSETLRSNTTLRRQILGDYHEVLVDEFQDTNPLQFDILHHFVAEGVRLYCVGDPAQSIYGFRGAEFDKIIGFTSTFHNSIELPLSVNYRSPQSILDLSNWLLSQSPIDYNSQLTSYSPTQAKPPSLVTFNSSQQEAAFIANTIQLKVDTGRTYKDHMILVRSNRDAKSIEVELLQQKIPHIVIGGITLTKLKHIRDVIALLRIVHNRYDELAWIRYLEMWPKIGEKTAQKIFNDFAVDTDNVLEVLVNHLGKNHPIISTYWLVLADSKSSTQKAVYTAVRHLAELIKNNLDNWNKRREDLKLMVEVASRFDTLGDYIETFAMNPKSHSELGNNSSDVVRLTTVHSAKGTEAPICFVSAISQSNYPSSMCSSNEEMEEERRILYVALTRAKEELYLTRVEHSDANGFVYMNPDHFLNDLPKNLVNEVIIEESNVKLTG